MRDLSVVVPTWNQAAMLDGLLESLAAQVVPPDVAWEVVVVDNNCTDDTAAVVARHAAAERIPGLRRVVEPAQGARAARCRGVHETTAPLLALVDDDTLLDPGWIAAAVAFMAGHPRAGAVGGRIAIAWGAPPTPMCLRYAPHLAAQDYGDAERRLASTGLVWLVSAGLAVRREALAASGWVERGYLPGRIAHRPTAGEDNEMNLRIRRAGWELWYSPAMRQTHRVPASRMTVDAFCRLFRGNARTDVVFDAMSRDEWPALAWRARAFARELRDFAWYGARGVAKRLLGRAAPDGEDRVRAVMRRARLRGALDVLLDPHGLARFERDRPADAKLGALGAAER
jgi:glycosyltransferase involved in cell wall biosynthesis